MQSGFSRFISRLTPAVKWLLGIEIAVFLLLAFAGAATKAMLGQWLILTPASLLEGHVWKLVTTALFPQDPITLFFDILILFMFMPFLEREWGTRRFVRFALIITLVSNVVAVGFGLLLGGVHTLVAISGLTPFVYAAIIAYGAQYANHPISLLGVIQMKGKTLAIGIAALVVIAMLVGRNWVEGVGHITGMLAGWVIATGRFTPRLWILKWRRDRLRRRYTVLDGGVSGGLGGGFGGGAGPRGRRDEKKWLN